MRDDNSWKDRAVSNGNDDGRPRGRRFRPAKGGILMTIELDRRILNELRNLADRDGVGSLYQEIRNACYAYVNARRSESGSDDYSQDEWSPPQNDRKNDGIVSRIGAFLKLK